MSLGGLARVAGLPGLVVSGHPRIRGACVVARGDCACGWHVSGAFRSARIREFCCGRGFFSLIFTEECAQAFALIGPLRRLAGRTRNVRFHIPRLADLSPCEHAPSRR
jgi:hypothetical protein